MVAVTKLALGLSAVAGAMAAPAEYGPEVQPRETNFVLGEDHPLFLARRAANLTALLGRSNSNYVQNYKTGGTVNFQTSTNAFTLSYNVQQDFVVGVGWNPGGTAAISHSGSWTVNSGLGSLGIYGWTTNPLVEYYIMDCNHGVSTGGSQKGSVTSDGATYAIWEHQQVNQPSIQGTSTFNQYISIRNSCTTSGTITVQNHFNAWKNFGMNLGSMNFQVIAVESWSGSGSASQSMSNTASSSPPPPPPSNPPPPPPASSSSPPPPSSTGGGGGGGSCSAQWGQCGGIGWSGPTCCASGYTCHVGNAYYSQCY